jgi:hypothetical protein
MKKTVKVLLFALLAPGFVACTAPIEIETSDSHPVIVIYGCLTGDTVRQKVKISASAPYFDENQNISVSNAAVNIKSSDGQTFKLLEDAVEKGLYVTVQPLAAIPGVTYTLNVDVDFDSDGISETYAATTTMTAPVAIDSVAIKPLSIMGYKHYAFILFAQDSPADDYYLARFVINDTIMTYRVTDFTVFSDESINGQYIDNVSLEYFDDMENYAAFGGNMELDSAFFVRPGYKITLLLSRIEPGYFKFINQCRREKNGENPFFGSPPSNIETNVSNGGVGYFTAFSTVEKAETVPGD